jgi:hypothetical protein
MTITFIFINLHNAAARWQAPPVAILDGEHTGPGLHEPAQPSRGRR